MPDETRELFRIRIETKIIGRKIPELYEKIKHAVSVFKQANIAKTKKGAKKGKRVEKSHFGISSEEIPIIEVLTKLIKNSIKFFRII